MEAEAPGVGTEVGVGVAGIPAGALTEPTSNAWPCALASFFSSFYKHEIQRYQISKAHHNLLKTTHPLLPVFTSLR